MSLIVHLVFGLIFIFFGVLVLRSEYQRIKKGAAPEEPHEIGFGTGKCLIVIGGFIILLGAYEWAKVCLAQ